LFLANFVPGAPDVSRIVKVLGVELATPATIFFILSYFISLFSIKNCKSRPCIFTMIFVSISVSALLFVAVMYMVWHLYFEQTIYLP
jgi:hypothetical protein